MGVIYYHTMPALKNYFQPASVTDAVSLLSEHGDSARVLAGGTDLLVQMRDRVVSPAFLVDISRIPDLNYIRYQGDYLAIGALATIRDVELSPIIKKDFPVLYDATHIMATTQIRNMGTVAGNICRASPAADTAPPLLVLDARVVITGPAGNRTVPLNEFFTGPGKTVLKDNEMVSEIQVPRLPKSSGSAFLRISRVAADLAKVNTAVVIITKDGICKDARIALGAVAARPVRAAKAEAVLKGKRLDSAVIEEAASAASAGISPISDVRSTAEYRKEVSRVLVRRAIVKSVERLTKGE